LHELISAYEWLSDWWYRYIGFDGGNGALFKINVSFILVLQRHCHFCFCGIIKCACVTTATATILASLFVDLAAGRASFATVSIRG